LSGPRAQQQQKKNFTVPDSHDDFDDPISAGQPARLAATILYTLYSVILLFHFHSKVTRDRADVLGISLLDRRPATREDFLVLFFGGWLASSSRFRMDCFIITKKCYQKIK
jgi:hypothetical protein